MATVNQQFNVQINTLFQGTRASKEMEEMGRTIDNLSKRLDEANKSLEQINQSTAKTAKEALPASRRSWENLLSIVVKAGTVFTATFRTLGRLTSALLKAEVNAFKFRDAMFDIGRDTGATTEQMTIFAGLLEDVSLAAGVGFADIAKFARSLSGLGVSQVDIYESVIAAVNLGKNAAVEFAVSSQAIQKAWAGSVSPVEKLGVSLAGLEKRQLQLGGAVERINMLYGQQVQRADTLDDSVRVFSSAWSLASSNILTAVLQNETFLSLLDRITQFVIRLASEFKTGSDTLAKWDEIISFTITTVERLLLFFKGIIQVITAGAVTIQGLFELVVGVFGEISGLLDGGISFGIDSFLDRLDSVYSISQNIAETIGLFFGSGEFFTTPDEQDLQDTLNAADRQGRSDRLGLGPLFGPGGSQTTPENFDKLSEESRRAAQLAAEDAKKAAEEAEKLRLQLLAELEKLRKSTELRLEDVRFANEQSEKAIKESAVEIDRGEFRDLFNTEKINEFADAFEQRQDNIFNKFGFFNEPREEEASANQAQVEGLESLFAEWAGIFSGELSKQTKIYEEERAEAVKSRQNLGDDLERALTENLEKQAEATSRAAREEIQFETDLETKRIQNQINLTDKQIAAMDKNFKENIETIEKENRKLEDQFIIAAQERRKEASAQFEQDEKLNTELSSQLNNFGNALIGAGGQAGDLEGLSADEIEAALETAKQAGNEFAESAIVEGTKFAVEQFAPGFGDIVAPLFDLIDSSPQKIEAFINGVVTGAIKFITTIGTNTPKIVFSLIRGILDSIPDLIKEIINSIPLLIDAIVGGVPDIIRSVVDLLPEIVEDIVELLPALVDSIIEGVPDIIDASIGLLPDVIQSVIRAVPRIIEALVKESPKLIEALTLGVGRSLRRGVTGVFSGITRIFTGSSREDLGQESRQSVAATPRGEELIRQAREREAQAQMMSDEQSKKEDKAREEAIQREEKRRQEEERKAEEREKRQQERERAREEFERNTAIENQRHQNALEEIAAQQLAELENQRMLTEELVGFQRQEFGLPPELRAGFQTGQEAFNPFLDPSIGTPIDASSVPVRLVIQLGDQRLQDILINLQESGYTQNVGVF